MMRITGLNLILRILNNGRFCLHIRIQSTWQNG